MKQHYISAKKLSLWMRLTKKWTSLYTKVQETTNLISLKKLNNLSLLLGVKRKIALTALAGVVTLGAQAQINFEQVGFNHGQIFPTLGINGNARPVFVDLDNDADQDMLIGDTYGNVNYYTNENNVFTQQLNEDNPFNNIAPDTYWATPTFVDLDNDGDQDLVLGLRDELRYFTNDDLVFNPQEGTANNPFEILSFQNQIHTPAFSDVDGDNDLDLLIGNNSGTLQYFTNVNNVFTEQTGTDNPFDGVDVGSYSAPTFDDLDGDNDEDLIIGALNGDAYYFEKTANSVFVQQTGTDNPLHVIDQDNGSGQAATPALVDFDGDNDLDVVIGVNSGELEYYQNDNGDFTADNTVNDIFIKSLNLGDYLDPVFVDLDEDGDLDLVGGTLDGTFSYFKNTDNDFVEQFDTDNPFDGLDVGRYSTPTFTDLDDDGDLDLVSGESEGSIKYYQNTGGVFEEQTGVNNPLDDIQIDYNSYPEFIDLDGDDDLDLVLGSKWDDFKYYTNDANVFTEQIGANNPFSVSTIGYSSNPAFADLDQDGDLDLLFGDYYGELFYYTNEDQVFTEQTGNANPFNEVDFGYGPAPTFADIDGDGDLDVFVGNNYGALIQFRNSRLEPTGLLDFTALEESLNLYPNPASDLINTEEGQLEIFDAIGNHVLSIESTGTVDVSGLESGIYFVSQNSKRTKLIIE